MIKIVPFFILVMNIPDIKTWKIPSTQIIRTPDNRPLCKIVYTIEYQRFKNYLF